MQSIIFPYVEEKNDKTEAREGNAGTRKETAIQPPPFPGFLGEMLPYRLTDAIRRMARQGEFSRIEEIRLRRGTASTLTTDRGTCFPGVILTGREMDETLTRICGGSLYAHTETIGEGYVILPDGVRVGICGRAATENGHVIGVYDPTALSVRIPWEIPVSGRKVADLLRSLQGDAGVLIYAPPGVGKTTLLRAVIRELAGGKHPKRVAVVDSRGELGLSATDRARGLTVDALTGYPRPLGIEIAARTLNAELVVCDEIGGVEEADAIIAAQNCGVPLLATAHGQDLSGLLRRTGIRRLHEAGIFGYYVGIARLQEDFSYEVTAWEDAEREIHVV